MKKNVLWFWLIFVACAQLQHGQEQPVIKKSAKDLIYATTCAGAVENWTDCYDKARRTCTNGYSVISSFDNHLGTRRDLTFQCKK